LRKIATKFCWTAYDHLGGLIVLNLVWTALSLPWILVGYMLVGQGANLSPWGGFTTAFLAVELVVFAPPTMLLFLAGACWARGEKIQAKTLFAEVRRFALRAQLLGLVLVVLSLILVLNIYFYQQFNGWPGLILSTIMVWFLVAALLLSMYLFPLLTMQDERVWYILRQSFLLAIDNIKLSFGLLLMTLFTFFFGIVSGIGLFCGLLAALALLMSICFRELLPKYTGEPLPEEVPRKWRELIRPWEE